MKDNRFKLLREPLGKYAYIPDCQLQFLDMKITYLNYQFFYRITILAILVTTNSILGYSSANINIGIYTFVYTNYIANIVNVLCSIALGVCLWQRTSQSLHITDALKQTILYTELGYVTVCDTVLSVCDNVASFDVIPSYVVWNFIVLSVSDSGTSYEVPVVDETFVIPVIIYV